MWLLCVFVSMGLSSSRETAFTVASLTKTCNLFVLYCDLVWFKRSTKWFNQLCVCPIYCGCNLIFGLFLYFMTMWRCYFCNVDNYVLRESYCFWVMVKYLVKSGTIVSHNIMPGARLSQNIILWALQTRNCFCMHNTTVCCCWLWKNFGASLL